MPDPIYTHTHTRAPGASIQDKLRQLANYDPMAQLEEGSIYIHTHTRAPGEGPELQGAPGPLGRAGEVPDIHTHTPIHIHEKENQNDTPLTPEGNQRERRMILGKMAEERMAEILSIFGDTELGLGTKGEPDLILETKKARYAVEVKTMLPMRQSKQATRLGYKANQLTLELSAWDALGHYAKDHKMARLLAVEVRVRRSGKGHVYHVIRGEMVDQLAKPGAKWLGLSIYDLPAVSQYNLRPGIPWQPDYGGVL